MKVKDIVNVVVVNLDIVWFYIWEGLFNLSCNLDNNYQQFDVDDLWCLWFVCKVWQLGFLLFEICVILDQVEDYYFFCFMVCEVFE